MWNRYLTNDNNLFLWFLEQEFFSFDDCFDIIEGHMTLMNKFLQSDYLNIQFATVACLANIFNKRWLNYNENDISCVKIQEFYSKLVGELQMQELSIEQGSDVDRKTCIVSTRLQLYCSIIGSCYSLRKQMWFGLIEFCCQQLKLSERNLNSNICKIALKYIAFYCFSFNFRNHSGKTQEIVNKLCFDVFQTESSTLLADLFPHLLSSWIDNDYLLLLFPSILTQCKTHDDFIIEYLDIITLRILEHKTKSMVDQLVAMVQARSLAEILKTVTFQL